MFRNKDVNIHFDKWAQNKRNILFITGLSGSGKTTTAQELLKTYKANYLMVDRFQSGYEEHKQHPIINKFFLSHTDTMLFINEMNKNLTKHNLKYYLEKCEPHYRLFFEYLAEELEKSKERYIVEGVQIYLFLQKDSEGFAYIIKNVDPFTAFIRRTLRNKTGLHLGKLVMSFNHHKKLKGFCERLYLTYNK